MKLYIFDPKTLTYKRLITIKKLTKISILFVLLIMLLGVSSAPPTKPNPIYYTETEKLLIVEDLNEFSEDKLINKIDELNFKFPYITLAQAILETGHYDSKIFKENNNLFGMKEARVRLNLAKGTQHGHAYYDNWEESVMDYALWYSTFAYKCKNEKQVYKLLNKQYAEANHYVQALKRIIKKYNLKEKFTNKK